MADKKYSLVSDEPITIPSSAADKLISSRDGLSSLLYIYLMRNGGKCSLSEIASKLGKSESDIERAFSVLISLGLCAGEPPKPEPEKPDELPQYTAEDVIAEMKNGAEFPFLVEEVQKALGRMLSSDDLIRLFGIYDHLGLPPEVILLLVNYCADEFRERYGGQRRPTMRYIEKAAFSWERDGICTLELAEARVGYLINRKSISGRIKTVLGISGRQLTSSEQKYVDSWADMGFPIETIEIAFDRTVMRTGKLAWNYMNTILKSWRSAGLITPEQVMSEGGARKPVKNAPPAAQTHVSDEDTRRMRRLIDEMKGGQNNE